MYPAALISFTAVGNGYYTRNQSKALKDQIKALEDQITKLYDRVVNMEHDIKRVTTRMTEMEIRFRSVKERLNKDCSKNK